jgi:hypothetical protein
MLLGNHMPMRIVLELDIMELLSFSGTMVFTATRSNITMNRDMTL